ncbi:hypothetical protein D3C87_1008930 [compost metagenome]
MYRCSHEPHTVLYRVPVLGVDHDDGRRAVHHILQWRALDALELRFAVELRRGHFQLAFLDGRRLRNAGRNRRFFGLRRSRNRSLDVLFGAVVGNVGKVRRQFVCRGKRPRALHVAGAEPAAGDQHITVLVANFLEDMSGGVGHVEQLGALDWLPLRGAVGDDQLGGCRGDVDLRDRWFGQGRDFVFRIALAGQQIDLPALDRGLFGFLQLRRG